MKKKFSSLLFLLFPMALLAQTAQEPASDRNFGLGVRASIFQTSDLQRSVMPPNRLLINFDPFTHFRGEFQFGYTTSSDQLNYFGNQQQAVELSNSCTVFGLGAHYLVVRDQTKFALGVRYVGFSASMDDVGMSSNVETDHERGFSIGPVIGAEHFFSKWFSVGAEFSYLVGNSETEYASSTFKPESKSAITESSLVFRFYPF